MIVYQRKELSKLSFLWDTAEAATSHREAFSTWRERPAEFNFDGRYPLLEVFDRAAQAWKGSCMHHMDTHHAGLRYAKSHVHGAASVKHLLASGSAQLILLHIFCCTCLLHFVLL